MSEQKSFTILESQQAHEIVVSTYNELQEIISLKLKDVKPTQSFLVRSRIVTLLFQMHFGMVINTAEKEINRQEKELCS